LLIPRGIRSKKEHGRRSTFVGAVVFGWIVEAREAFYGVAEARDGGSGSVGLGLAITERVMALHGGYSKARNASDGGLIVELCFPKAGGAHEMVEDCAEGAL